MPPTLLIVEDEPDINYVLRSNFKKEGYNVLSAASAEAGRRFLIPLQDDSRPRLARRHQPVDTAGPVRFIGHNGDQNGFRAYLSLCPDQRAGSLLAFNTETRAVTNDPSNRESAESRIALATDRLCGALAR